MKTTGSILAALVLFSLIHGLAIADDKKIDTSKLIGKWEENMRNGEEIRPIDAIKVEFTKNGKMIVSGLGEWDYKIEKNRIKWDPLSLGEMSEIILEIKSLTDESLTLYVRESLQTQEFKRMKK
jgi:uncharacterized protein (TIGR03066 family)